MATISTASTVEVVVAEGTVVVVVVAASDSVMGMAFVMIDVAIKRTVAQGATTSTHEHTVLIMDEANLLRLDKRAF